MSIYQKVLKKLNIKSAEAFKYDVQTNSVYYIFTANSIPNVLSSPLDSTKNDIDTYNSMIFGNKIKASDVSLMIQRNDWSANTIYDIYDPQDHDLSTKTFFVVVNEGSNYFVYKCLDNNNRSPSTVQPSGTDAQPFNTPNDGYVWKYLYTLDDFSFRTFATAQYIPVDSSQNSNTISSLGGIEVITVDPANRGSGYNNYTIGSFTSSDSIRYNNNANRYALNSSASPINAFYTGCLLKVTSIATNQTEYKVITDYSIIGSDKIVTIDTPFSITLKAGDLYEIYPNVVVQDLKGTSTSTCIARAIISANTGNSVSLIEVINPGSNYRNALAFVSVDNSVGVTSNTILNPIISPIKGHGSDLVSELFAYRVCVTSTFSGNSGVFLSDSGYQTIGIIKDPTFANVTLTLDSGNLIGAFNPNENVYRYRSYTLNGNVSITSGNTIIVSDDSSFGVSLQDNDRVIVTNGLQNVFANVISIIDTNTVVLDQAPDFTFANCKLDIIQSSIFGKVASYDYNVTLSLYDVSPNSFDSYTSNLVGDISNCTATINSASGSYITINDRPASDFNQFLQLTKMIGSITSDSFVNNETLLQDQIQTVSSPSAVLYTAKNNLGVVSDVLYATMPTNTFKLNSTITGASSGGTFITQYKYNGELTENSGEIVYLENLNYITRAVNQSETIKIILEF